MPLQDPAEELPVGLVASVAIAMDSIARRRDEQHEQSCCNYRPKCEDPDDFGPPVIDEGREAAELEPVPDALIVQIAERLDVSDHEDPEWHMRELAQEYGYPAAAVQAGLARLKERIRKRVFLATYGFPPLD